MPHARLCSPPGPARPDWAVADAVRVPVWLADPAGQAVYFNQAYRAYTGRLLSNLLADGWAAVHPADRAAAEARWAECARAAAPYSAEYRLRRTDGEFRWHACEAAQGPDGLWVGTLFDVHARREGASGGGAGARPADPP
jgi:PAS domain S-box-containing protein